MKFDPRQLHEVASEKPLTLKCISCEFLIGPIIDIYQLINSIEDIEVHYGYEHGTEPTEELVRNWLKQNTPYKGKSTLIPHMINDLDLKFIIPTDWPWKIMHYRRYSIIIAKIINQMKDKGEITANKQGRAYVYSLVS